MPGNRSNATRGLKELAGDVRLSTALDGAVEPEVFEGRPRVRGDCADGPRPCPWVSCRHHLYLEANGSGSITFNSPSVEPDEMADSCALDVADEGGLKLEDVGDLLGLTRERVRQIEWRALQEAKRHGLTRGGE